ncbi:hypothetical protein GQ53DRAFT_754184 [Thozetella sp. PMI_491]|nr:hypothetical protein GQ53DRAFT_754184 [Thozetella sp. PMI_491]
MAHHGAVFPPRYPTTAYEEEGTFHTSLFPGTEDGLMDPSAKFIDPSLQSLSPSSAPYPQCDIPAQPVQRYLLDHQKTAFFNTDFPPKMHPNRALRRQALPVHAPSHARFPSPTSSHEPSSTGSVRSPPDTESYYDNNFPATPPDTSLVISPYIPPSVAPYEFLNHQSPLHFTNMGPSQASAFVNPVDVQPSQSLDTLFESETSIDFGLGSHGTFGAYEEYDAFNLDTPEQSRAGGVDEQPDHLTGSDEPQTLVKDEIKAASFPYPDPTQHGLEDDSDDEQPEEPPKRRKTDEDTDYKPGKRTRSHGTSASASKSTARRRTSMSSHQNVQTGSPDSSPLKKRPRITVSSTSMTPAGRAAPAGPGHFPCPHCKQGPFKDQASLDSHVKKQHTRPYHCVFHFAGCTSTFATKNEWKRHVASQHLLLHYWLCQEGSCNKLTNHSGASNTNPGSRYRSRSGRTVASTVAATAGPSFGPPLPNGAIFNRKDLYTQHLRRMHTPPNIKKQAKQQQQPRKTSSANTTPDWEAHLRTLASRAMQDRCALPTYMRCPAPGCEFEFRGPDAWDQRMEHVGRHLERAAASEEPPVEFGGPHDPTLIEWASHHEVAVIRRGATGRWELNNPLRPTAKMTSTGEMILHISSTTPAGPSVKDEIVVDHEEDDDDDDAEVEQEADEGEENSELDAEGEMEEDDFMS